MDFFSASVLPISVDSFPYIYVHIRSCSGPHFSRIFPHSNWIPRDYLSVFSPNAGKCGTNADQNNSEYGHFLRSTDNSDGIIFLFRNNNFRDLREVFGNFKVLCHWKDILLSLSLLNQIILEFAKFISTLVWVNMKKSVKRFCKRIIQTINPFMHGAEKLPSIWYMMRYKKWKSCNVWSFFNIIRGHTYYSARVDVVYTYYFISFSKDWIK